MAGPLQVVCQGNTLIGNRINLVYFKSTKHTFPQRSSRWLLCRNTYYFIFGWITLHLPSVFPAFLSHPRRKWYHTRVRRQQSLTGDWKFSGKSFTYDENNNGPKTVPCGTSNVTMMGLDRLPSQITDWMRPVRNDSNHLSKFSWIP